METGQLRTLFLEYFKNLGHTAVPSSSLVPENDPTLLFTNSGMVQFKDVFLGTDKRSYVRATSSQRCVRAGGKHNDLENVGYTARHHTFFEMLGNFSFGDYFKREAIEYAWQFLTETLKIPQEKLWVTVFEKDDESANIWLNDIKVDKNRFSRCGERDNFWSMGDTGPCGPCTEIYYDHGPEIAGGPPGSLEAEGDRYVEIWNLVFMQYDRTAEGKLLKLPKPSVDTGMGLERVAAVMQKVHSNYDIDIFKRLIQAIADLGNIQDLENKSLRVIADHIRSSAFLVVDGVVPNNEGRGYVLRRIMRRAIRHGFRLGFQEPFFYRLVKPLAEVMGSAYPELVKSQAYVERILQQEEQQFARTLEQGLKILEQDIVNVSDNTIPGETVFRLYDTYGFPVDLTNDIARERGMHLDMDGFNESMAKQRTRAREASQFSMIISDHIEIPHTTTFTGYETLEQEDVVVGIYQEGEPVESLKVGEKGAVVLSHTSFYAEAGGQVGDQGIIYFKDGEFTVHNTKKLKQAYLHYGVVERGTLKINESVKAVVDKELREATALNHSATHLLHAALRKVLGNHVQQKGSLVEPSRLRFDFTHFEPLTTEQTRAVEHIVNAQIRLNAEVQTDVMNIDEAMVTGATALFGEKYGDSVRVLRMGGDFSVELCGGTHVHRSGDIGLFKITSEAGISAGVRRIEAVTGAKAMEMIETLQNNFDNFATLLKTARDPKAIEDRIQQLITKNVTLEKDLKSLKLEMASGGMESREGGVQDLSQATRLIQGVQVLAKELSIADPKILRETVDRLKDKLKTAVVVVAAVKDGKVSLIAGVTKDCTNRLSAADLVKHIAGSVGGKGGGRPDMAEAGGNNPEGLQNALEAVYVWVEEALGKEKNSESNSKPHSTLQSKANTNTKTDTNTDTNSNPKQNSNPGTE